MAPAGRLGPIGACPHVAAGILSTGRKMITGFHNIRPRHPSHKNAMGADERERFNRRFHGRCADENYDEPAAGESQ